MLPKILVKNSVNLYLTEFSTVYIIFWLCLCKKGQMSLVALTFKLSFVYFSKTNADLNWKLFSAFFFFFAPVGQYMLLWFLIFF